MPEIVYRPLNTLTKLPNNPRQIQDRNFKHLMESVRENPTYFEARPVILSDRTGELVIIAGNMRYEAAKKLKLKTVPTFVIPELTEEKEREIAIRDNVQNGEWDYDLLSATWNDLPLNDWGVDLPEDWLAEPVEEDESKVGELIDKAAELQEQWQTALGQLWEIPSQSRSGDSHRLLVGDSTQKADVGRLCGDSKPLLMVTDPPYGVNYNAQWRQDAADAGHLSYGAARFGKVANDDRSSWLPAFEASPSVVAYVWHASASAVQFAVDLMACGYEIRNQIIWSKPAFAISRGHYNWQHEPCWYAVRKGNKSRWVGDHSQSTIWEISNRNNDHTDHSTEKPLECMARPIRNHEGDVYDPFIGSGTTMVAAEQLKRICYGIEIEPKYAAVTLERMSNLGLEPKCLE